VPTLCHGLRNQYGRADVLLKLIKLLYLLDREALLRWGRPVTADRYVSMDNVSAPGNYEVSLTAEPEIDELAAAEVMLSDTSRPSSTATQVSALESAGASRRSSPQSGWAQADRALPCAAEIRGGGCDGRARWILSSSTCRS
jgi:hypothetical protein